MTPALIGFLTGLALVAALLYLRHRARLRRARAVDLRAWAEVFGSNGR